MSRDGPKKLTLDKRTLFFGAAAWAKIQAFWRHSTGCSFSAPIPTLCSSAETTGFHRERGINGIIVEENRTTNILRRKGALLKPLTAELSGLTQTPIRGS